MNDELAFYLDIDFKVIDEGSQIKIPYVSLYDL